MGHMPQDHFLNLVPYRDRIREEVRRRRKPPAPLAVPQGFKLVDVLTDFVKMMKEADIIDAKQKDKMIRYLQTAELKATPTGQWSKRAK
jgi:hypothetical protein